MLASLWDKYDNKALFFGVNSILLGLATLALVLLLKKLNKNFREHAG